MLTQTPAGLDEVIHVFGSLDDTDHEQNHIVSFDLPYPLFYDGKAVSRSRCHKLLVANFQKSPADIKTAGLTNLAKNYVVSMRLALCVATLPILRLIPGVLASTSSLINIR